MTESAFRAFADVRMRHGIGAQCQVDFDLLEALAADPLCLRLLVETTNRDLPFERVMVDTRRWLLAAYLADRPRFRQLRPLVVALCHQGFNNEYVADVTPEEDETIRHIDECTAGNTDEGISELEDAVLVTGLYQPLVDSQLASLTGRVSLSMFAHDVRTLIIRTLVNPIEEARLGRDTRTFGRVDDEVSGAVQAQYEQHPYPRWLRLKTLGKSIEQQIQEVNPSCTWPPSCFSEPLQVLVAGCGTGRHPLRIAADNPGAEVLAVDFSRTALGYAQRMARESGVTNVRFLHGDLLRVRELGRQFHHIECSGVLHHIRSHHEAWAALADVLDLHGTLRVSVYSKAARLLIQSLRSKRRWSTDSLRTPDVRRLRGELLSDPLLTRVTDQLARIGDFFATSTVRDLLFHAYEHNYTLSELATLCGDLDLSLLGVDASRELRGRINSRAPDMQWPIASFDQWQRVESAYAGSVQMFVCWLQKRP